ncbi:MAG: restriction endonuclease [bacterium]
MLNLISLQDALIQIKKLIEEAIATEGEGGKRSVINSGKPIGMLHDVVKSALIRNGVNAQLIKPALGATRGELKLAGFLKLKKQDICVLPNHLAPHEEVIDFNGILRNFRDPYGELFTEHILTINVRSQLSSIEKNIDTMYERTYAEPMNLHRRLPKMVLGEVYLIALRAYDSDKVKKKRIAYTRPSERTQKYLEKYILGFSALNSRTGQGDDYFKYERVALILVDFSQAIPKVYKDVAGLKEDRLLPTSIVASMQGLSFDSFVEDLLIIYERRFGTNKLS